MSGGIYKITNKINGRFYIGRALSFAARWEGHRSKLKNNKHNNKLLQSDWNQFGADSFSFDVLEIIEDRRVLAQREHDLINQFFDNGNKCYNAIVSSGAVNGEGLTSGDRQRKRREALDKKARAKGWGSWEKFKTAVIRGEVDI